MLFNSPEFIVVFLPGVLLGFYLLRLIGVRFSLAFLLAASLAFYAWEELWWLLVLIGSISVNHAFGYFLIVKRSRAVLATGITFNLLLLCYFKYLNFAVETITQFVSLDLQLAKIVLPIGISFFTFQQIAFLVDVYQKKVRDYSILQYAVFVAFFPQLIAGPIVHHTDIIKQLRLPDACKFKFENIHIGASIFVIGLLKKLLLADSIELFASPVFDAAQSGAQITFFEAWGGALSYTFQIYFDFSGYSDMAIGLARMFGLKLPVNFNSPYKADNIIAFWRNWHITLSTFLRDYLYFPLGGNKLGQQRRFMNLMAVMVLGGLWHGAAWTFVAWGALHGAYLIINHIWRYLRIRMGWQELRSWNARIITFLAIVVAWVLFRAESFEAAREILEGMAGFNGIVLDGATYADFGVISEWMVMFGAIYDPAANLRFAGSLEIKWLTLLLLITWAMPNTQDFFRRYEPVLHYLPKRLTGRLGWLQWSPGIIWAWTLTLCLFLAFPLVFGRSPFLYFQF